MKEVRTHDTITRTHDVKIGSEKSFGIVFGVVSAIIGLFPLIHGGEIRPWAFGCAAVFVALAYGSPKALRPLNYAWFKFGMLLHKIISPLIMGLIYVIAIVPTGLVMKIGGKNQLALKKEEKDSYWIKREPAGPEQDSFERQF